MPNTPRILLLCCGVLAMVLLARLPYCLGQEAPFRSFEVLADGRITFHYRSAGAKSVLVTVDTLEKPIAMSNSNDIWSATTPPLAPEIYWYSFNVDGHEQLDPYNKTSLPNYLFYDSVVTVHGPKPQPWEADDIPHGAIHHHFYNSRLVKGLPDERSEYYVYTPPGYNPAGKPYPTLYLLHGFSMTAYDWTYPGGANFILDHLIAQGKAQPMVIVMPLSYGLIGSPPTGDHSFDGSWDSSDILFSPVLLKEIMPMIDAEYHVSKDRKMRAIAGLSMGGAESIMIGLNHPDQFAWIGGFSSGTHGDIRNNLPANYEDIDLSLVWIGCGDRDPSLQPNLELVAWMKENKLPVTSVIMPGAHTWTVWHQSLIQFAPLLFRPFDDGSSRPR